MQQKTDREILYLQDRPIARMDRGIVLRGLIDPWEVKESGGLPQFAASRHSG